MHLNQGGILQKNKDMQDFFLDLEGIFLIFYTSLRNFFVQMRIDTHHYLIASILLSDLSEEGLCHALFCYDNY